MLSVTGGGLVLFRASGPDEGGNPPRGGGKSPVDP